MPFPYTTRIILSPEEKEILETEGSVKVMRSKRYKDHSGCARDDFKAEVVYGSWERWRPIGYGSVSYKGKDEKKFSYQVTLDEV